MTDRKTVAQTIAEQLDIAGQIERMRIFDVEELERSWAARDAWKARAELLGREILGLRAEIARLTKRRARG